MRRPPQACRQADAEATMTSKALQKLRAPRPRTIRKSQESPGLHMGHSPVPARIVRTDPHRQHAYRKKPWSGTMRAWAQRPLIYTWHNRRKFRKGEFSIPAASRRHRGLPARPGRLQEVPEKSVLDNKRQAHIEVVRGAASGIAGEAEAGIRRDRSSPEASPSPAKKQEGFRARHAIGCSNACYADAQDPAGGIMPKGVCGGAPPRPYQSHVQTPDDVLKILRGEAPTNLARQIPPRSVPTPECA